MSLKCVVLLLIFLPFSFILGKQHKYYLTVIQLICFRDISTEALLDIFMMNKSLGKDKASGGVLHSEDEDDDDDNAPLFYTPGKRGFYSPRAGKASSERFNAFRNVGRYVLVFTSLNR